MYPYRQFDRIAYQKHYRDLAPNHLRELLLTPECYQQASALKAMFEKVLAYAKDGNQACQDFLIHECQFLDVSRTFLMNDLGLARDNDGIEALYFALAEQAFREHKSPAAALMLFHFKLKNNQLDDAVECLSIAIASDNQAIQQDLRYMFQPAHLVVLGQDSAFRHIVTHCKAFTEWVVASGIGVLDESKQKKMVWEYMQGALYDRVIASQSEQADVFIAWLKARGFMEKEAKPNKRMHYENALSSFFEYLIEGNYELAWQSFVESIIYNKHHADTALLRMFTIFADLDNMDDEIYDGRKWVSLLSKLIDFKHNSPAFRNYIDKHPLIAAVADDGTLASIQSFKARCDERRNEAINAEDGYSSDDEIDIDDLRLFVLKEKNLTLIYLLFPNLRVAPTKEQLAGQTFEEMLLSEALSDVGAKTLAEFVLDTDNSRAAFIKFNLMFDLEGTDKEQLKAYFLRAIADKELDIIVHLVLMVSSYIFHKNIDCLHRFKDLCPESQQFLMDYRQYFPKLPSLYPDLADALVSAPIDISEPIIHTQSLTEAVLAGNLQEVQYHLQQGANPHERIVSRNIENNHFYLATPLHHAVTKGDIAMVNELLNYLAKYRLSAQVYFDNKTPLDVAKTLNHQEIIASLEAFNAAKRPDFFALFSHLPSYKPFWQHEADKQQKILGVLLQSLVEGHHEQVIFLLKKHPMMLCLRPNPNSRAGHLFHSSAFEYAFLTYDENVLRTMLACLPDTHEGLQIKHLVREQMVAMSDPLTADKSLRALCDSKKAMVEALLASHLSSSSCGI